MHLKYLVANIDKTTGGPSNSIPPVCSYLSNYVDMKLYCFKNNLNNEKYAIESFKSNNPFFFSKKLYNSLKNDIKHNDIVHTQGIWLFPNIVPYIIKKKISFHFVLSPRGMLSKWALENSRIKKKIVYTLGGQKKAFEQVDCFHATSLTEYKEIRSFGLKQPVALIPNGTYAGKISKKRKLYISFFGRIHPKKGIENLINAFNEISNLSKYSLNIYGIPEDLSYFNKIEKLCRLNDKINLLPPVYGEKKTLAYQESSFVIMPSFSENFGNVILEAISQGIPVIASQNSAWGEIEDRNVGFLIEPTQNDIKRVILDLNNLSELDINKLSENSFMYSKEFQWEQIGEKFLGLYRWLSSGSSAPNFIIFD